MKQDMTKGNPMRVILVFAIPLFVGSVFQMFYNMMDSVIVGRFVSSQALAAVGASSSTYNLIIALTTGFTSGASVIIAQVFGANDPKDVKKAYITSMKIIFSIGIMLTVLGLFIGGPLLKLLGTPSDIFADSLIYVRFMVIGILATCLYNGMAAFLRSVGNSVIPLVALIISSCLNVVLDLFFVLYMNMGVSGVAIATVLSQLVSGVYCFLYVRQKMPQVRFTPKEFIMDRSMAREMIRIGIPACFSTVVVTVSVMFIQAAINKYGSDVIAAYTAANKVEQVCMCLGYSIGMATGIFCAQNLGAGLMERVRKGFWSGIKITLLYHAVICTIMFVFAGLLIRMFTTNPVVVEIGTPIVRIIACFGPVLGVVFVLQNFLRNMSDVTPTIVMSFSEILARGVLPFVLSATLGYYGIWWATPIGWTASLIIGLIRYRSGKWRYKSERAS